MSDAELTFRSIVLAILLTLVLAMSNAYLALKLGILTSASIPAAIISMGILRLFKNASILENNAVQTAASAGEAVAGGIVYTIPALIIIQYWHGFDYVTNFLIALCGGILGVLFSIPLRRILVNDNALKFPEGQAIAEVLKSSREQSGLSDIALGGAIGAVLGLLQSGFKIIASSGTYWFVAGRSLFGVGIGFSATMLGAGFLVGHEMAVSIFLGAVISWLVALPMVSYAYPQFLQDYPVEQAANLLWDSHMRYLGIGAMLFAGVWTFIKLVKPLVRSIRHSLSQFLVRKQASIQVPRTDKDMPWAFILGGVFLVSIGLFLFFQRIFPIEQMGLNESYGFCLVLGAVVYVLIVGFLFSVITAYFSGLVGVTASPGSSVVIAGILAASWLVYHLVLRATSLPLGHEQLKMAEAIVIIIGSVVTGIAAIANDNTQDLKVGQLVGATPWKQQVMLLLGVLISSLIIPPVMQLLFDVYGIAGVMPHAGMDMSQALPAPTAALLAAITEAVFHDRLPWAMMLVGAFVIMGLLVCDYVFKLHRRMRLSILGVAIGMYLPMSSSFPLFIGGMIALMVKKRLRAQGYSLTKTQQRTQIGTLIACGLVAGSALMDVFLAVPFSMLHNPDALSLVGAHWSTYGVLLGALTTLMLVVWIVRRVTVSNSKDLVV